MSHGVVPRRVADGTRDGLAPLARRLAALGVSANAVTICGFALSIAGAGFVAAALPVMALPLLIAGSLCDTLDGALARAAGGGTRLGGFLDSVFDRLSDGAFFGAAAVLGAIVGDALLLGAALVGLVASFQVSYIRAKAELAGLSATVGLAPREARLVLLLIGLGAWAVTGQRELFVAAIVTVAVLATLTLLQRLALVSRSLSDTERNR